MKQFVQRFLLVSVYHLLFIHTAWLILHHRIHSFCWADEWAQFAEMWHEAPVPWFGGIGEVAVFPKFWRKEGQYGYPGNNGSEHSYSGIDHRYSTGVLNEIEANQG